MGADQRLTGTPETVCRFAAQALYGRAVRVLIGGFLGRGLWGTGYFAPCGARPEALPLDFATFEKVDETFILRFALSYPTLDSHLQCLVSASSQNLAAPCGGRDRRGRTRPTSVYE